MSQNSSLSYRQSVSSAEEALFHGNFTPPLRASPPFTPFHPFVNRVGVKACACIKSSILGNEKYVGDVILMKTIHIGGPGSKRIKNRGEAEQYKATASHQAIISQEQFDAVQKEKERRCNVETNGTERSRKHIRYKTTFSMGDFLTEREE